MLQMVMVGVPPQASILKRASYNLMLFLTIIQVNMCMTFMPSFSAWHSQSNVLPGYAKFDLLNHSSVMKSAFKGVVFWIGQKDVEFQVTVRKAVQLQEKCEQMQAKYLEKMKQVEAAYTGKLQQVQRASMQKIQALEEERQNFINDKNELQEKYTEKSRHTDYPSHINVYYY